MFVVREQPEDVVARPVVAFDYLAVVEELHSGRIRVSNDAAAAEYDLAAGDFSQAVQPPEMPDETLSVDPDDIAVELGLASALSKDLGRLRRSFAMSNHPDRVAPHLRSRAQTRMQVANGLIDDALRRAEGRGSR